MVLLCCGGHLFILPAWKNNTKLFRHITFITPDGRVLLQNVSAPIPDSLNGFMRMKMMQIICYGLHTHYISNRTLMGDFRVGCLTVLSTIIITTPTEGRSFGKEKNNTVHRSSIGGSMPLIISTLCVFFSL